MKQRVADYIANFLIAHGINDIFTVPGGGAMHLNDAFGNHPQLHCVYNHHEQACAIAAEAYAKASNKIAAVCVTSGPGGTNAITGVLGGWLDSIPMLIISGQVRVALTVRSTGLNLRAFGEQEFDIIKSIACMTKYTEMVIDPQQIRFSLEKALFFAHAGRPGPSWLDIPLDVQSAIIETDSLVGYTIPKNETEVLASVIDKIIEKIKESKRPVIIAGSAIRYSDGFDLFHNLIERLQIPVVTACNSIDIMPDEHPLYTGRIGGTGDRAGNFAVQNSDLILSLGCRLSVRQVGYNSKLWAREAYTIIVDIDPEELKKPTIHVSLPVCANVKDVMEKLLLRLQDNLIEHKDWIEWCQNRKKKYPVVQQKHYDEQELVNVYAFFKELSLFLPDDHCTVVSVGSARIIGSQAFYIKKGQRFIMNSGVASMGYALPAAVGVSIANKRREITCITGEGSLQMNLQELQTIQTNKLPIKIFIINNQGYHTIRQTQKNFFGKQRLVGVGPESGGLEFPEMSKIAYAYGYPYKKCTANNGLKDFIQETFAEKGPIIAEVFVSTTQNIEPKSSTKVLSDGRFASAPLEDLAPFLPREEFLENMIIKPLAIE